MAIRTIEVPFRDDYNVGVGADLASGSPMITACGYIPRYGR